jgi:hypothetical protein
MARRQLDNNTAMSRVVIPAIAQKAGSTIASSAGHIG